jgi:hypothetical protein
MNKISFKRQVLYILLAIVISLVLVSCSNPQYFWGGQEQQTTNRDEEYSIDPNTILANISQGDIQVFNLLMATPPAYPPPSKPITWGQDDFYKVTQAFFQVTWKENLADWRLEKMSFTLPCDEIDNGPQAALFSFFKKLKVNSRDERVVRDLFINPERNSFSLLETEYQPIFEKWPAIDLSKVKIKIEDALEIAENNQGKEFRQQVDNQCFITAKVDASGKYNHGWFISYLKISDELDKELWLNIDIQTGNVSKV